MRFEIYEGGLAKDGRSGKAICNLIVVQIKTCKIHHLTGKLSRSFVVIVRFMLFQGTVCGMRFVIHGGWGWQKMAGQGWPYPIK